MSRLGLKIIHDGDWESVRRNFDRLKTIILGPEATVTFSAGTITNNLGVGGDLAVSGSLTLTGTLTLSSLTAQRLVATDAAKGLVSSDLFDWVTGTATEIEVTDGGDGKIIIGIVDPLIVSKGGTGAATFTDHSLLAGSGTGAITAIGAAINGQLPIGSTGNDPVLATLTAGAGLAISNGAGSITLAVDGPLEDLDTLGASTADGEFLVATGAGVLAWESGATARTSMGVGTGDSPTFAGLDLTGITDNYVPYMSASGFADSPIVLDGTKIVIGDTTGDDLVNIVGGNLTVEHVETAVKFLARCYSTSNLSAAVSFYRARGTKAVPTAVQNGDVMGYFGFNGYDGTGWSGSRAQMRAVAFGNWTAASHPTYLDFGTTDTGSTTVYRRMFISRNGYITIGGGSSPTSVLDVTHATPYLTLQNSTHEDTDGGGESRIIHRREDGAGTATACFQFEASHDGAGANDQLGKGIWSVNTGAGLVQALEIGSDLLATFAGNISATTIDLTGITDSNIPYMSASGFADSPLSVDGTTVKIVDGGIIQATNGGPTLTFDDGNNYLEITACYVGIGTSTPSQKLHMYDANNHTQLLIEAAGVDKDPQLYLKAPSQTWYLYVDESQSQVLRISDGSVRLQIDTSGNVDVFEQLGIGEAAPVTSFEITKTAPYITLHNSTNEDGDGGRESRLIARGQQSGGEETILGYLEFAHDGAADDQNGMLRVYINNGTTSTLRTKWGYDGSFKHGDGGVTNYVEIGATGDTKFVGGAGLPFGSCYGNHIGWSQANAAQNTWYNISDADMLDGILHNVTHDGSGKLTVANAGMYLVTWSCCFENDAANDHVEVGIEVSGSGSADAAGQAHLENKFASEEEHASSSCILDLAASATLELAIRTTDAGTPTISVQAVNISCVQIGGT